MKFIIDHQTNRLRMKMSEEEYQQLKIDADKLGVSVEDMIQKNMDAHARKMFPEAFKRT